MVRRPVSRVARHAAELLGASIRAGRADRGWRIEDLAERAQVSRATIMKVERGDLGVAVGTVFDCASLVGVPLFHEDEQWLADEVRRTRPALMRKKVRRVPQEDVDLDF